MSEVILHSTAGNNCKGKGRYHAIFLIGYIMIVFNLCWCVFASVHFLVHILVFVFMLEFYMLNLEAYLKQEMFLNQTIHTNTKQFKTRLFTP